MVKINCPLCDNNKFRTLFTKRLSVVRCQKCGLIFTNPQLDAKEIKAHYDKSYYYCPDKDPSDRSRYTDYNARYLEGDEYRRFDRIFQKLSELKRAKGCLLDAGAATGFFVKAANKKGWNAEGVEFSLWASRYARKYNRVKMFNGTLHKAKFKDKTFDVVTMLDFLEHVGDPLKELKEANRILKDNGVLYLETINFDHFITRYLIREKYIHMVPEFHLFYFGRKQLRQLLTKAGFQIIDLSLWSSSVGDYESCGLRMYWQYLLKLLGGKMKGNYALNDVVKIIACKK